MNRRKFFGVFSGAAAVIAGGLAGIVSGRPGRNLPDQAKCEIKNLLADAAAGVTGGVVVTAIDPSNFDQAMLLQTILNNRVRDLEKTMYATEELVWGDCWNKQLERTMRKLNRGKSVH